MCWITFQNIFLTFAVQTSRFFIEMWASLGFCFFTGAGGLMGDIEMNSISEEGIGGFFIFGRTFGNLKETWNHYGFRFLGVSYE